MIDIVKAKIRIFRNGKLAVIALTKVVIDTANEVVSIGPVGSLSALQLFAKFRRADEIHAQPHQAGNSLFAL